MESIGAGITFSPSPPNFVQASLYSKRETGKLSAGNASMISNQTEVVLKVTPLTPDNFKPYGQVLGPIDDGVPFGPDDAQLHLTAGIPRFYIMNLKKKGLKFSRVTYHANVTQCLGSIGGLPWYLGVARSAILYTRKKDEHEILDPEAGKEMQDIEEEHKRLEFITSQSGHCYIPPKPEEVQVFRVEGPQFLKLHAGTWHAGPLFEQEEMNFYNLELADTNIVDHTTHDFDQSDGVSFMIDDQHN